MNILTFDIEDWFHILDHGKTESVVSWDSFESRIEYGVNIILEALSNSNTKATFFCLGWVAKKHPQVIKRIGDMGYEIGSHSMTHQLLYNYSPDWFKKDLEESIRILEDITGQTVKSFRAPGFSVNNSNLWVFETLGECGIETDSSIFPAARAHGGLRQFPESRPVIINYHGNKIKEFPQNYFKLGFLKYVFSGGGYFRLSPYQLIRYFTKRSPYVMSYLHPRDFDKGQPLLDGLPLHRRFKSYYGITGAKVKLEKWLQEFNFTDIETASAQIDWDSAPIVQL